LDKNSLTFYEIDLVELQRNGIGRFLFRNKQPMASYTNCLTWQMYYASLSIIVLNFADVYHSTFHRNFVSASNMSVVWSFFARDVSLRVTRDY